AVATRSLLRWSSRRKRVTSLRTTAAPRAAPWGSLIGSTCGREEWSAASRRKVAAWANASGRNGRRGISASPRRRGNHPGGGQGGRLAGVGGGDAQEPPRRRVGHLDAAVGVDHQHRVGERIDRRLAGALCPQQPGRVGTAVIAQLGGHAVERLGELAQLVAGG